MAAKLTLSETLINNALDKVIDLIKNDNDRAVLDKPYSNFSVVVSFKKPPDSIYELSKSEIPNNFDLKEKGIFIAAKRII